MSKPPPPPAARALDQLLDAGYAPSKTQAIAQALVDAAQRLRS